MSKSILIAGELNVDLILSGKNAFAIPGRESIVEGMSLTLGSASAICAVGLARLDDSVRFIGRVGQDDWGELCIRSLNEAGVDASPVIRDGNTKTGITVSISNPKDRCLITYLGAISELRASDISSDLLKASRHLHVSSYYLQHALRNDLPQLFQRAKAAGLTTSMDPGFDPEERWSSIRDVLPFTDVFLPNEVELRGITGQDDPREALLSFNSDVTCVAAKLGSQGSMAIHRGAIVEAQPFPVKAVDTTGAGDSFNAGFLHSWLAGERVHSALRFANACGALSTLSLGGTGSQPTGRQVAEFLQAPI